MKSSSEEQLCAIMQGQLRLIIKHQALPKPPPWGGLSVNQNIEMINTCTIDNILYFLHILFIYRADILQEFQKKDNVAFRILIQVHLMMKDNLFSDAKIAWL